MSYACAPTNRGFSNQRGNRRRLADRVRKGDRPLGSPRPRRRAGRGPCSTQDALLAALEQWPSSGVPNNPGAWLTTVARRRGIDTLRRDVAYQDKLQLLAPDNPLVDRADLIGDHFNLLVEMRSGVGDVLSGMFAALADPTRRDLVARLTNGDATVGELAAPYPVSIQAISKHLKVLEHAGLVSRSAKGHRSPVHLEAKVLELMSKWIERYRVQAEASYLRLDAVLAALDGDAGRPSALEETA